MQTATRVYPIIKRTFPTTAARLKKLQQVKRHVEEARRILEELRKTERSGDIAYFSDELGEWLTCDHGEAGFEAFLGILETRG